jgi:hypothetical protein
MVRLSRGLRNLVVGQFGKNSPSGAKARMIFTGLMYGLKPVPFTLIHHRKKRAEAIGRIET